MIKKFTFLFLIFLFSKTFLSAQGSCASPDGSFFGFDGSFSHTYATANANGCCYNNLNPGQTYCWTYFYPSSGDFMMDIIINGSCGNCDGGNLLYLGTACSGGCSSIGLVGCTNVQYNFSCAVQNPAGFEHGGNGNCSPAMTCGSNFTWCITVPAGCSTMDVCPMVECSAGPGNCAGLMPIVLLDLTGEFENGKTKLKWITASENNNDYFTVERAIADAGEEQLEFVPIGNIKGAGNSSAPISYHLTDNSYSSDRGQDNDGYIYYRLKQTDFDGKFVYYGPISVKKEDADGSSVLPSISSGLFTLLPGKDVESIIIYNSMGEAAYHSSMENSSPLIIDLSGSPNGIYFARFQSKFGETVRKILLNR